MGLHTRKGILYYVLCSLVVCLWLYGSKGIHGFEIFRSKRDIFTNLKCNGDECQTECESYGAECVSATNCDYCRCLEGNNTFVISKDNQGRCKSDEEIEPKSVPKEAFWLKNNLFNQCLKLEGSSSIFIIGTNCVASATLDMLWIWTTNSESKQLMNVKTLNCTERLNANKVAMKQCRKTYGRQKIQCDEDAIGMTILWNLKERQRFLYFPNKVATNGLRYAMSSTLHQQLWSSEESSCETSTGYQGCYRFSDGSFMKYLTYSETNLRISAPIFKENDGKNNCEVNEKCEIIRDGQTWTEKTGKIFSIERETSTTKRLKIITMENLKAWNGSLIKLNVSCKTIKSKEEHCVLLKLQSLPQYYKVINRTPPPSTGTTGTGEVTTTSVIETTTEDDVGSPSTSTEYYMSSERVRITFPNKQSTNSKSSTTENPQEGLKEASESGGTKSTAIPVTVTLLLVAVALALGCLVYYRRRKRAQVPPNHNNDIGAVNYSKEIYEEPDRIYETLKENEQEVPFNQPGTLSDTYSYPDSNSIANPTATEQGYTYAKDTNMPGVTADRKALKGPISNGAVYHTLERPEPTSDNFYNYLDNTNIAKPSSSELEYTYAKDTDLPRKPEEMKIAPGKAPAVHHTLEQSEQPTSDNFYNYITNIAKPTASEQEYTYAKDTDLPRATADTKGATKGPASNAVYHTLEQEQPPTSGFSNGPGSNISTELEYTYAKNTDLPRGPATTEPEYSYAKNTDIPLISMGTQQTSNGLPAPPVNSGLYHSLEEPNPPQVPVYSTLEEPEDADKPQVTDERPNYNDHVYIDVIGDYNGTDSRNASNSSSIA